MKTAILELLRSRRGQYVSGEELSASLGVSRTAVWKHIQSLRQEGYLIDSRPNLGYCLQKVPDCLFPAEIRHYLNTKLLGREMEHRQRVRSTNDLAKTLADQGAGEGLVVLAEEQEGGRGRLGRHWVSPAGVGIWLSVVLRPSLAPVQAPQLTLVAATAVAGAIEKATGLPVGIKWPNDLLVQGKKVCGILTEMKAEIDVVHYVVLGIGINANLNRDHFPVELQDSATSLKIELAKEVSRARLTALVLEELERSYLLFLEQGLLPILATWKGYNVTIGRMVSVTSGHQRFTGRAVNVDQSGALIVECTDGCTRQFHAGEVTLKQKE